MNKSVCDLPSAAAVMWRLAATTQAAGTSAKNCNICATAFERRINVLATSRASNPAVNVVDEEFVVF